MANRIILHCDLNNFFASVESIDCPEYKNVPMAVCGDVKDRHGIVLAKNEKAKSFGVKTAETIWQAKEKCPTLVIAPPHYEKYVQYSKAVRTIYEQYTDKVEPFGMDECWLDVTGSLLLFGSGKNIANEIRRRVKKELGLTISVGVSFNKVFAKLASDMKKPDAVTVISEEDFKGVVWPLKIEEMIGVGKSTKKRLNDLGIYTLGDLAAADSLQMKRMLGKMGQQLCNAAAGKDLAPVLSNVELPKAKSYGRSITGAHDMTKTKEVADILLYLSEKVSSSLRAGRVMATAVQLHIRDEELSVHECQAKLSQPTRITEMIFSSAMELFSSVWFWDCNIRSVGVRAFDLVPEDDFSQYNLFYDSLRYEKLERLEAEVYKICKKYGNRAVFHASTMNLSIPKEDTPAFTDIRFMAKNQH